MIILTVGVRVDLPGCQDQLIQCNASWKFFLGTFNWYVIHVSCRACWSKINFLNSQKNMLLSTVMHCQMFWATVAFSGRMTENRGCKNCPGIICWSTSTSAWGQCGVSRWQKSRVSNAVMTWPLWNTVMTWPLFEIHHCFPLSSNHNDNAFNHLRLLRQQQ